MAPSPSFAEFIERVESLVLDGDVERDSARLGLVARFQLAIVEVIRSTELSEDEATKYLYWCVRQTGRRVDAIVGEKHRRSYDKAANLLVATAEVLAKKKARADGDALIATYRQRYSRFSAFQAELRSALRGSTLLAVT